jgi:nitrite reductase (NADH) large subunit
MGNNETVSVPVTEFVNHAQLDEASLPIVIVGTGPVGIRILQSLQRQNFKQPIVIYGGEPWQPYNRVRLSSFLAGDIHWNELVDSQSVPDDINIVQHHNCKVVQINSDKQYVIDERGQRQNYSKLILALGSRAHVPSVPGNTLGRVFTFRDLQDTQELVARRVQSRCTVVVGGGLLGLEAARAMARHNTQVIVVDHATRLMNQQLDDEAAALLNEHVLSLGIRVYLGSGIERIDGERHVESIVLKDGRRIECDTVILATGIVPNIELAREAKLSVGRGIRVNDLMQTSNPQIYAVGECAEHREKVYGIVAPGYEQAEVAVHSLQGKKTRYNGSIAATSLKVVGKSIFSMGRVGEEEYAGNFDFLTYADTSNGVYRKLVFRRRRLVGVIAVGEWPGQQRVQESITNRRLFWPWQIRRFIKTGELWNPEESSNPVSWPAHAIICNCMNVNRGACSQAISQGCADIDQIMQATGASTVCGSCRPLLAQLIGAKIKSLKLPALKSFFVFSLISLLFALAALFWSGASYNLSVLEPLQWDILWRDGLIKQITGYSVLGLSMVALLMSLRKRWSKIRWLQFDTWRYVHVAIGLLGIIALLAHTGLRLGNNLNFWLMSAFVGLLLVGSLSALFMSLQHKLDAVVAKQVREKMIWLHILLFWPVPALLAFHITKVYYF